MTPVELQQLQAELEREIAAAAARLQAHPDQLQASGLLDVMADCLRYDRRLIEDDAESLEQVRSLMEASYSRLSELHSAYTTSWLLPDESL